MPICFSAGDDWDEQFFDDLSHIGEEQLQEEVDLVEDDC